MIRFERHPANPVIPRAPGTFRSVHAANPDLLDHLVVAKDRAGLDALQDPATRGQHARELVALAQPW